MSDTGVQSEVELTPEAAALAEKGREGLSTPSSPAVPGGAPAAPQRPEGIPEKFWDAEKGAVRTEALLASYTELEKKLGAPKEDAPADPPPTPENDTARIQPSVETEEGSDDGEPEVAPAEALSNAIADAQRVYAETGELGEESIQALVSAGVPEAAVQMYLEGVKAQERALAAAAYEAAGGEDNYRAAVAWAAKNWDTEQIAAYDAAIGNPKLATVTVAGLMASFRAAEGTEGALLEVTGAATGGDTYSDMADFHKDLRAADDAGDLSGRRKAVEKLERSKRAGTLASAPARFGR